MKILRELLKILLSLIFILLCTVTIEVYKGYETSAHLFKVALLTENKKMINQQFSTSQLLNDLVEWNENKKNIRFRNFLDNHEKLHSLIDSIHEGILKGQRSQADCNMLSNDRYNIFHINDFNKNYEDTNYKNEATELPMQKTIPYAGVFTSKREDNNESKKSDIWTTERCRVYKPFYRSILDIFSKENYLSMKNKSLEQGSIYYKLLFGENIFRSTLNISLKSVYMATKSGDRIVFPAYDGRFLKSTNYTPEERPWFKLAQHAELGNCVFTGPYSDINAANIIVRTYSCKMPYVSAINRENDRIVISFDFTIDYDDQFVSSSKINSSHNTFEKNLVNVFENCESGSMVINDGNETHTCNFATEAIQNFYQKYIKFNYGTVSAILSLLVISLKTERGFRGSFKTNNSIRYSENETKEEKVSKNSFFLNLQNKFGGIGREKSNTSTSILKSSSSVTSSDFIINDFAISITESWKVNFNLPLVSVFYFFIPIRKIGEVKGCDTGKGLTQYKIENQNVDYIASSTGVDITKVAHLLEQDLGLSNAGFLSFDKYNNAPDLSMEEYNKTSTLFQELKIHPNIRHKVTLDLDELSELYASKEVIVLTTARHLLSAFSRESRGHWKFSQLVSSHPYTLRIVICESINQLESIRAKYPKYFENLTTNSKLFFICRDSSDLLNNFHDRDLQLVHIGSHIVLKVFGIERQSKKPGSYVQHRIFGEVSNKSNDLEWFKKIFAQIKSEAKPYSITKAQR